MISGPWPVIIGNIIIFFVFVFVVAVFVQPQLPQCHSRRHHHIIVSSSIARAIIFHYHQHQHPHCLRQQVNHNHKSHDHPLDCHHRDHHALVLKPEPSALILRSDVMDYRSNLRCACPPLLTRRHVHRGRGLWICYCRIGTFTHVTTEATAKSLFKPGISEKNSEKLARNW